MDPTLCAIPIWATSLGYFCGYSSHVCSSHTFSSNANCSLVFYYFSILYILDMYNKCYFISNHIFVFNFKFLNLKMILLFQRTSCLRPAWWWWWWCAGRALHTSGCGNKEGSIGPLSLGVCMAMQYRPNCVICPALIYLSCVMPLLRYILYIDLFKYMQL